MRFHVLVSGDLFGAGTPPCNFQNAETRKPRLPAGLSGNPEQVVLLDTILFVHLLR